MKKKENSRREFLKKSSLTGLGAAFGMGISLPAFSENNLNIASVNDNNKKLRVKPRYHR